MKSAAWLSVVLLPLVGTLHAFSEVVAGDEHGRLMLAAPDKAEVGFGSWDPAASGGQAPSWAYLITLRGKSPEEARVERASWGQNAAFANAIHFFNSGELTRKLDVPWKPSSVPGWGADEGVGLSFGSGGHITYRRTVMGPVVKGSRAPVLVENKIFDRHGAQVREGIKNAGVASFSGRFARGPRSIFDLASGEQRPMNGGSVLFSRYDDSYVVYWPGAGGVEYHDSNGQSRWRVDVADGPLRLAIVSPGGQFVFVVAGDSEKEIVAAMLDAAGRVLWKTPVSVGSWAGEFSRDGRHVALVTADTNWIFESATGKVLAQIPMSGIFGGEKLSPRSSRVYIAGNPPRALVIAGTLRLDQRDVPHKLPPAGNDVLYTYDAEGSHVYARLPPRTIILGGEGVSYEPAATLSPDGGWLYYLTGKGLFARRLE